MALWRVQTADAVRVARGPATQGPDELLADAVTIDGLLADGDLAGGGSSVGPVPPDVRVLTPLDGQPVWCAGVTYEVSRDARVSESTAGDHYERIYDADRPELFLKALPGSVRGPGDMIGIRADSGWDVPEPELAAIADSSGRVVAFSIGNDVSSRTIEGENPLYLPQAKIYRGSCAVGPCLVPVDEAPAVRDIRISLHIHRQGVELFSDSITAADLRRSPQELIDWLFAAQQFPVGVALLTGTALVPAPEFTLAADDQVAIELTGLGRLRNVVEVVGRPARG